MAWFDNIERFSEISEFVPLRPNQFTDKDIIYPRVSKITFYKGVIRVKYYTGNRYCVSYMFYYNYFPDHYKAAFDLQGWLNISLLFFSSWWGQKMSELKFNTIMIPMIAFERAILYFFNHKNCPYRENISLHTFTIEERS